MRNNVERFGVLLVAVPLIAGVCAVPFREQLNPRGDIDAQMYVLLVVGACLPGLLIFSLGRMMGEKRKTKVITRVVYRDRSAADALDELAGR